MNAENMMAELDEHIMELIYQTTYLENMRNLYGVDHPTHQAAYKRWKEVVTEGTRLRAKIEAALIDAEVAEEMVHG